MLQFFEAVIRMTSALSSFSWSSFEFLHIMLEMQSGVVSIIVGICVRFPGGCKQVSSSRVSCCI